MPDLNVMVIYGGVDVGEQKKLLKSKPPHIVVGTPGRIKAVRPPAAAPKRAGELTRCAASACASAPPSWPRTAT